MPSALDNRPLTFEEFEHRMNQVVYVSATPGPYELTKSGGLVVEQVIRPTGLVDPQVEIRPVKGQVDDLLEEIRVRAEKTERVLVTTLTKRMAEDLSEYFTEIGVRCRYLHSEVETLDRIKILRDLRRGEFDVLIGINLLREGLDLPEVSLVAILDADKEGYLRSATSLIQTMGRCARHVEGRAILYADRRTDSMNHAISETNRRREKQLAFNKENNITPMSIIKSVDMELARIVEADYVTVPLDDVELDAAVSNIKSEGELAEVLQKLEAQMREARCRRRTLIRRKRPPRGSAGILPAEFLHHTALELIKRIKGVAPYDPALSERDDRGAQEHIDEEQGAERVRERVKRRDAHDDVHTGVESKRDQNSDARKDADPAVSKNKSGEGQKVREDQSGDRDGGKTEVVTHSRKKVFCDPADEIAQTRMPANDDKILCHASPRAKTRLLDDFSQFHVIDDLHGEASVRTAGFVSRALEQLESADADV